MIVKTVQKTDNTHVAHAKPVTCLRASEVLSSRRVLMNFLHCVGSGQSSLSLHVPTFYAIF